MDDAVFRSIQIELIRIGFFMTRTELGRGTFGCVYKGFALASDSKPSKSAADTAPGTVDDRDIPPPFQLGRAVAIKLVHGMLRERELSRALHEVTLQDEASKGCMSVLPILYASDIPTRQFEGKCSVIVTDFMEVTPFGAFLRSASLRDMRCYMFWLLAALSRCAALGVVHRDVKPRNFLYNSKQQRGCLTDFGLAELESSIFNKARRQDDRGHRSVAGRAPRRGEERSFRVRSAEMTEANASNFHHNNANSLGRHAEARVTGGHAEGEEAVGRMGRAAHGVRSSSASHFRSSQPPPLPAPHPTLQHTTLHQHADATHASQLEHAGHGAGVGHQSAGHARSTSAAPLLRDADASSATQQHKPHTQQQQLIAKLRALGNSERDKYIARLVDLYHARKCEAYRDGSVCPKSACAEKRTLWLHMEHCNNPHCETKLCFSTRNLLGHFKTCCLSDCPLCIPVKAAIREIRAAEEGTRTDRRKADNVSQVIDIHMTFSTRTERLQLVTVRRTAPELRVAAASFREGLPRLEVRKAGTPGYRAPEVLLGNPYQTTAIDVFSAGVILASLLSGRYPFFADKQDGGHLLQMMQLFGAHMFAAAERMGKPITRFPTNEHLCYSGDPVSNLLRTIPNERFLEPGFEDAVDLALRLMSPDPLQRITADAALSMHPFFNVQLPRCRIAVLDPVLRPSPSRSLSHKLPDLQACPRWHLRSVCGMVRTMYDDGTCINHMEDGHRLGVTADYADWVDTLVAREFGLRAYAATLHQFSSSTLCAQGKVEHHATDVGPVKAIFPGAHRVFNRKLMDTDVDGEGILSALADGRDDVVEIVGSNIHTDVSRVSTHDLVNSESYKAGFILPEKSHSRRRLGFPKLLDYSGLDVATTHLAPPLGVAWGSNAAALQAVPPHEAVDSAGVPAHEHVDPAPSARLDLAVTAPTRERSSPRRAATKPIAPTSIERRQSQRPRGSADRRVKETGELMVGGADVEQNAIGKSSQPAATIGDANAQPRIRSSSKPKARSMLELLRPPSSKPLKVVPTPNGDMVARDLRMELESIFVEPSLPVSVQHESPLLSLPIPAQDNAYRGGEKRKAESTPVGSARKRARKDLDPTVALDDVTAPAALLTPSISAAEIDTITPVEYHAPKSTSKSMEQSCRRMWEIFASARGRRNDPAFMAMLDEVPLDAKEAMARAWRAKVISGAPGEKNAEAQVEAFLGTLGIAELIDGLQDSAAPSVAVSHPSFIEASTVENVVSHAIEPDVPLAITTPKLVSIAAEADTVVDVHLPPIPKCAKSMLKSTSKPGYRKVWEIYAAAQNKRFDTEFIDSVELLPEDLRTSMSSAWKRHIIAGHPDEKSAQDQVIPYLQMIGVTQAYEALAASHNAEDSATLIPAQGMNLDETILTPSMENANIGTEPTVTVATTPTTPAVSTPALSTMSKAVKIGCEKVWEIFAAQQGRQFDSEFLSEMWTLPAELLQTMGNGWRKHIVFGYPGEKSAQESVHTFLQGIGVLDYLKTRAGAKPRGRPRSTSARKADLAHSRDAAVQKAGDRKAMRKVVSVHEPGVHAASAASYYADCAVAGLTAHDSELDATMVSPRMMDPVVGKEEATVVATMPTSLMSKAAKNGCERIWEIFAAHQGRRYDAEFLSEVWALPENFQQSMGNAWRKNIVFGFPDEKNAQESVHVFLQDIGVLDYLKAQAAAKGPGRPKSKSGGRPKKSDAVKPKGPSELKAPVPEGAESAVHHTVGHAPHQGGAMPSAVLSPPELQVDNAAVDEPVLSPTAAASGADKAGAAALGTMPSPTMSTAEKIGCQRVWEIFAVQQGRRFDTEFLSEVWALPASFQQAMANGWRKKIISGFPDEKNAQESVQAFLRDIGVLDYLQTQSAAKRRGPPRSNSISRVKADLVRCKDSDVYKEEMDEEVQKVLLEAAARRGSRLDVSGESTQIRPERRLAAAKKY